MRLVAVVGSVCLTAACGGGVGSATPCTLIGANAQVGLTTADGQDLPVGYSTEVCLLDVCSAQPWKSGGVASVALPLPDDGPVTVQVRTLDAVGQQVDSAEIQTEVETRTPNGHDCEPKVGVVQLSRSEAGAYEQVPVPG